MGLIDDIQWKIGPEEAPLPEGKFESPTEEGMAHIIMTAMRLMEFVENNIEPFGITYKQFSVLRILHRVAPNPLNCTEIKDFLIHNNSDITRLTGRMEKAGLVIRKKDGPSKKFVNVYLSKEGDKLQRQIAEHLSTQVESMFSLSKKELEQLNSILGVYDKVLL